VVAAAGGERVPAGVLAGARKLDDRSLAVKPRRGGSSIGVAVVAATPEGFGPAMGRALQYDRDVLVEEVVPGVEFSVVVLDGPDGPVALAPTEPEKRGAVFGMAAKYPEGTAPLQTPIRTPAATPPRARAEPPPPSPVPAPRRMPRVAGSAAGAR